MNLVLSFVHPTQPGRILGPYACLRLDAEAVRERLDGPALASYRNHMWEVDERRFFRMDCTARVLLHYESPTKRFSRTYGPYEQFSCVDGVAYADNGVLAFVHAESKEWFCYDDGYRWHTMVVTDASDAAR